MLFVSSVYEPLNNELFIKKKIKDLNMIYEFYKRYVRMPILDISRFNFTGLVKLKFYLLILFLN